MNNTQLKGDEPAFPVTGSNYSAAYPGMTLRDWFAGMALATIREPDYSTFERMAETAYDIADAMFDAREGLKGIEE